MNKGKEQGQDGSLLPVGCAIFGEESEMRALSHPVGSAHPLSLCTETCDWCRCTWSFAWVWLRVQPRALWLSESPLPASPIPGILSEGWKNYCLDPGGFLCCSVLACPGPMEQGKTIVASYLRPAVNPRQTSVCTKEDEGGKGDACFHSSGSCL